MKSKTQLFIALAVTSSAFAGSPESPIVTETKDSSSSWFKTSINARARVESRDIQGSDNSIAGTFRVRPGFTLGDFNGLSLFAETEHTYAFFDDFDAGPGSDIQPDVANNTVIADPESNELNQLYLDYKTGGFHARVGRQRIILDNAAHIGNVGWRQNEQTFDATTLAYKSDKFSAHYSYLDQVNRIFGSDANGALGTFEGGSGGHLVNIDYTHNEALKTGAYAYFLDFDQGTFANSDTFGLTANYTSDLGAFYFEVATQSGHDTAPNDGALYGHFTWNKAVNNVSYTFGAEYLEEGFRTPLATAHAFNGFADVFVGGRIGAAAATFDGINDVYVSASTKYKGVVLKGFIHGFWDDSFSETYGWELDGVVAKKLTDDLTLLGKAAFFFADDSSAFSNDVTQISLQLDYTF